MNNNIILEEYINIKESIINKNIILIKKITKKLDEYTKWKKEYDAINAIFTKDFEANDDNMMLLCDKYISFLKTISEIDIFKENIDNSLIKLLKVYESFFNSISNVSRKIEKLNSILNIDITSEKLEKMLKFIEEELSNKSYNVLATKTLKENILLTLWDLKDEIIDKTHMRSDKFIKLAHNISAIQDNSISSDLPIKQNNIKKVKELFSNLNFYDEDYIKLVNDYNFYIRKIKVEKETKVVERKELIPKKVVSRKQRIEKYEKEKFNNEGAKAKEKSLKKEFEIPSNAKRYLDSFMPILLDDEYNVNYAIPQKGTPNYDLIINQMLIEVQKLIDADLASNVLKEKYVELSNIAENMYKK